MKHLFVKKWASLLVVLAFTFQILAPATYAVEGETENEGSTEAVTTSEDPTTTENSDENLSEESSDEEANVEEAISAEEETDVETEVEESATSVDPEDEDDIIDTIEELVDIIDESDGDDSLLEDGVDTVVDEVTDSLAGDSDETVADRLESLQERVAEAISKLKEELNSGSNLTLAQRLILERKIQQLQRFQNKLRAKILILKKSATRIIQKVKNNPGVYLIRWGVLDRGRQVRCDNLSRADIRKAIVSGERPEACNVDSIAYSGKISVDQGAVSVEKALLFEANDEVTTESGSSIAFDSTIAGHYDGLLVKYTPSNSDDRGEVNVTVELGTLNVTKSGAQIIGMHDIGNNHKLQIKRLVTILPAVTGTKQQMLIQNRIRVSNRLTQIRERLEELRLLNADSDALDNLEDVVDQTEEYNFDDGSATEVENELTSVLSDLSLDASETDLATQYERLRNRLSEIRNAAKLRKFNDKLIPFKDTDDDAWYTNFISGVKAKGIISGYKDANGNALGEFRPANNITVAEALKIALETAKQGTSEGTPNLASAASHWAAPYVKKAEELNMTIVSNPNLDLNRPATRGEIVRMVLEALGIKPSTFNSTDFSDVPAASENASYIQYAKELSIVSGDSGKTTFRPNDPINRAEVSKIASQIIEIILGEDLE